MWQLFPIYVQIKKNLVWNIYMYLSECVFMYLKEYLVKHIRITYISPMHLWLFMLHRFR